MEEQTQTEARPQNAETAAELILTRPDRAPEVILAFNGLNPPNTLFAALHGIGWTIPPVPPPPGNAIDWTPDPTTGADYTLKPWTVKEFKLNAPGWWTLETEKSVGAQTIAVLREHGVDISGIRGTTEAEESAAAPAVPAVDPSVASTVIVIDEEAEELAGFTTFATLAGRKKSTRVWREQSTQPNTALAAPAGRSENAWVVSPDDRATTGAGKSAIHMIAVPGECKESDVQKVVKLLGAGASVRELVSLVGGPSAQMITAVIPTHSAEMMLSNVRLRYPKLVCRVDG